MAECGLTNGLEDFQALVDRHRRSIYGLAYRLTGNREDAEDLLQESLLEAFRGFRRFHPGTRFDRWVYQIMTHTFIDKFKRRRRLETVSLEEVGAGEMPECVNPGNDPQEALQRQAWSEPVRQALDSLSPEFRAVVMLCDAQGLSYEEASRTLRCSLGTVRSRLHRAREILRNRLQPSLGRREK